MSLYTEEAARVINSLKRNLPTGYRRVRFMSGLSQFQARRQLAWFAHLLRKGGDTIHVEYQMDKFVCAHLVLDKGQELGFTFSVWMCKGARNTWSIWLDNMNEFAFYQFEVMTGIPVTKFFETPHDSFKACEHKDAIGYLDLAKRALQENDATKAEEQLQLALRELQMHAEAGDTVYMDEPIPYRLTPEGNKIYSPF